MIWLAILPAVLVMEVLALVLAPVLPLLSTRAALPRWLWWFQTPDASLLGDGGHFDRHADSSAYWQMVTWLARNRAYGFKIGLAGCEFLGYVSRGNPGIKNRHDAVPGWLFLRSASGHWYIKAVVPLGWNYCAQVAFGWQLDAPINGRCLFMFSPRITRYYRA